MSTAEARSKTKCQFEAALSALESQGARQDWSLALLSAGSILSRLLGELRTGSPLTNFFINYIAMYGLTICPTDGDLVGSDLDPDRVSVEYLPEP